METQIVVTVLAGIALLVALVGTVYPVLPGSLIAIVTLVVWALLMGSWVTWVAAIAGCVIAAVGWSASYVLTGRKLKEHQIPGRSVFVAVVCGIVGMFVIPLVGLFVGFALGLFVSEYVRRRDHRAALTTSGAALKAAGTGMLVEFAMLCLAGTVWAAGALTYFVTA